MSSPTTWLCQFLELHSSTYRSWNGPLGLVKGDRFQLTPFVLSFLKEFCVFFIFLLFGIRDNSSFPPHFTSLWYDRGIICIVATFLNFFS